MSAPKVRGSVPVDRPAAGPIDAGVLDRAMEDVAARAGWWAGTGPAARATLLDRVLADTVAAADDWLDDACGAKGLRLGSPAAGEELLTGVVTFVRLARLLRDSLLDIERTGRPRYPGPVRSAPGDRLAFGVFPADAYDRLLYQGYRAEVWMTPGRSREEVEAGQAAAYRDPAAAQGVAVVLGAGNVASLGPRDALGKLFVGGKVVVLKANPVNAYLVPHWRRAMAALEEAGVLRVVAGDAAAGAHLTGHLRADEVHVTGSDKTYDAIVFGPGEEGARRKAAGRPLTTVPVTAELGNVSPLVVVPGHWTSTELRYQAAHVASTLVNNAGFNCLTTRVVVTHAGWPQREAFLGALRQVLRQLPTRRAYYPGAAERRAAVLAAHPDALCLGRPAEGELPWTLVEGIPPGRVDDICFNVEAFCGLTAETALEAPSPAAFLDAAVDFCNDVLWGTLSATVLVDPRTARRPEGAAAVERAVAGLRYGAVGVNAWHALAFALGSPTWGAHPGHEPTDIQSGVGVVGNAYMFDRPEKSVVTGPFRAHPAPAWFATRRGTLPLARRLLAFEAAPSPRRLPGLLAAALRP